MEYFTLFSTIVDLTSYLGHKLFPRYLLYSLLTNKDNCATFQRRCESVGDDTHCSLVDSSRLHCHQLSVSKL